MNRNPHCTFCSLSKTCYTVCLWGNGTLYDNPIMFVGEAPGATEDKIQIPFVGNSGRILQKLIKDELKLSRNLVYITNVVKCRPPENRAPTIREIKACRPYFLQEVYNVRPRLIVTLGITAHRTLFPELYQSHEPIQMNVIRAYPKMFFSFRDKNIRVFSTYHPAAVLYSPNLREELKNDFKKIKELAHV